MARRAIPTDLIEELELPRPPSSAEEAWAAVAAVVSAAVPVHEAARGPDVFVLVFRGRDVEVWRMRGLPGGQLPDDDLVRAVVCTSDGGDLVAVVGPVRGATGADGPAPPGEAPPLAIQILLERPGERGHGVFPVAPASGEPPAPPELRRLGAPRPGTAWLGVAPHPSVGDDQDVN